ncbi:MAG: DUF3578 domain-containing protein [Methanobacteriaceae archaeon]|jgi:MoxR-like ATPase/uncharacterized protein YeaO (DUF488 family)|nr:DUF3578 domain-containing protein [Methanobacteriaceae archaeon]
MEKVVEDFKEILRNYNEEKQKPFKDNPLANKMRKEFKDDFKRIIMEIVDGNPLYHVQISPGKNNWANYPWAGFRNYEAAKTYQEGLTVVYAFDINNKKITLRIIQGYDKTSSEITQKRTEKLVEIVKEKFLDIYDKYIKDFDLSNNNVPYKDYYLDNLNSDEFLSDLKKAIEIYEYLIPKYKEIIEKEDCDLVVKDFKEILTNYGIEKEKPLKDNSFAEKMRTEFKNHLSNLVSNITNANINYDVKVSHGSINWVNIPWAGIKNYKSAKTFKEGLYLIFTFKDDESNIYLSLDQGNNNPDEETRIKIANHLTSNLTNLPKGFTTLKDSKIHPDSIISKAYSYDSLNSDELYKDLTYLISIYEDSIPNYNKIIKKLKINPNPKFTDENIINIENKNIWRIAPGSIDIAAKAWEFFKEKEYIGIGTWGSDKGGQNDFDYRQFKTKEDIDKYLKPFYENETKNSQAPSMIWNFVHEMKVGDIVIVNIGRSYFNGIGIITSDYISPDENPDKNEFELNHRRNVKWLITDKIPVKKNLFVRSTISKINFIKWNKIISSYGKSTPQYTTKLISYLYNAFKKEFLDTNKGLKHFERYTTDKIAINKDFNEIFHKKLNGQEVSDDIWDKILSPKKSLFKAYGNSKLLFEKNYELSEEELDETANLYFDTIKELKDNDSNLEVQKKILKNYSQNKFSKGFKTGLLSPTLYYLDNKFYVINKKTIDSINLFNLLNNNIKPIDSELTSYIKNNIILHHNLIELSDYVDNLDDFRYFDMFTHWLCSSDLGNYARDKPLPLVGYSDIEEDSEETEISEELNLKPKSIETNLKVPENVLNKLCAALNSGKHIILDGAPGTGKTELAIDLAENSSDNASIDGFIITTATSDWTTFDTIGGLMPDKEGKLYFNEGKFLEAIRHNKWLIIDEINRSDIDKAFGQLFTVLSGQSVELPYKSENGESIKIAISKELNSYYSEDTATYFIGKNWRIIATMNIYDKDSLFDLSYAFMRRFAFINIDLPENSDFEDLIDIWGDQLEIEYLDKLKYLLPLNEYREIGPAIYKDMIKYIQFRKNLGNHGEIMEEAILSYIVPQFEGLNYDKINKICNLFEDKEIMTPNIEAALKNLITY